MRVWIRSVVCTGAIALGMATHAVAVPLVNLSYNPVTGELALQNTSASAVNLNGYQVLTIGDGSYGPAAPASQGYLTGSAAQFPVPSASLNFPVTNTENGLNGLFSEIYAVNFSTTILTLSPYPAWSPAAPIGPAGSFYSMGPVAALGMTQADLLQRFLAAADVSPSGTDEFGKFLFSYELAPGEYSTGTLGDVVALVPEPGALALVVAGAAMLAGRAARRRSGR